MTTNLFKASSAAATTLETELRDILRAFDPADAEPLLARLSVERHPAPLLVFTGQYSSGKSTLIEALTDRAFAVEIGSGVTTNEATEYDWAGDVTLVDTPGVHAGRPQHDERAERALQAADLVLFVVTVELFDDVLVAHLRDVLGRLGKARQTLIVVTKAGTMDAATGVRDEHIKRALGPFDGVPWVECDAQYYLDGLDLAGSSPSDSAAFIEASGISGVSEAINRFASEQGEMGRLSAPLQLLRAISFEASATLSDDPDEQAALTVLARHRSALSKKRIHLNDLLAARSAQFRTAAVRAASHFADGLERDEQAGPLPDAALERHMDTLNEALRVALEQFEADVRQLLELQFNDLASEVQEIEASPNGRIAVALGELEPNSFEARDVRISSTGSLRTTPPAWAHDVAAHLKHFKKFWGAGDGVKAAAGGNGHKIVLKAGHAFGKRFKPWEAVRVADKIGKVAKVGGAIVTIGLGAYAVVADERAAVTEERTRTERRRTISQEILAQADAIVADAIRAVSADLDEAFKPELDRIDAVTDEILHTRSSRSDLRERLESIRVRAASALTKLTAAEPVDQS